MCSSDLQDQSLPTYVKYQRYLFRESLQRAHAILVTSEQTYTVLVSTWLIEKQRVHLIAEKAGGKIIPLIYRTVYEGKQLSTLLTDRAQSGLAFNSRNKPQKGGYQPSVSIIIPVSQPAKVEQVLHALSKQQSGSHARDGETHLDIDSTLC